MFSAYLLWNCIKKGKLPFLNYFGAKSLYKHKEIFIQQEFAVKVCVKQQHLV